MSVLVLVLVGFESRPCDPNVKNLEILFSDPYFMFKKLRVQQISPKPGGRSSPLTDVQWSENYRIRKALDYAAREFRDLPVLVLKDSSVSWLSYQMMKERVEHLLTIKSDLHFLTVWDDWCQEYQTAKNERGEECHGVVWSKHPSSTQAVIYTPESRDYVRHKLIDTKLPLGKLFNKWVRGSRGTEGEMLRATACVPNLIDFDITLSTSVQDHQKLNQCGIWQGSDSDSTTNLIWFLVIVALMLTVGYCIIVFSPSS